MEVIVLVALILVILLVIVFILPEKSLGKKNNLQNQVCKGVIGCPKPIRFSQPMPIRTGNSYKLSVNNIYDETKHSAPFEIVLMYRDGCKTHKLVTLFEYISKEFSDDELYNKIKFTRKLVDNRDPQNLTSGSFPKIIKIRPTGQILEYTGYTDASALRDWILNESLLF